MISVRSTSNCLRVLAVLQILTGLIVFIPIAWIAAFHVWLGLGQLPDAAFLRYVIRGGAFVQGAIGVLIWVIATDVVRFRPLAITIAAIYLASAPAFYFIDTIAGMPRFWCIFDGTSCFLVGSILFFVLRFSCSTVPQATRPVS